MRFLFGCALLAAGLLFVAPPVIVAPPALAEEEPDKQSIDELERRIDYLKEVETDRVKNLERLERLELLKQEVREQQEVARIERVAQETDAQRKQDARAFRYNSVYGGLSHGFNGRVKADNDEGNEVSQRLDLKEKADNDGFDPEPRFLAITGGGGSTFYRAGERFTVDFRQIGELRLLRTGDYKGTLDGDPIEANVTSLGYAAMLEMLLQEHLSVYGGFGVSYSFVDVTYTDTGRGIDARGADLYGVAGTRYYSDAPGERGVFVDIRGELIFPRSGYWEGQSYVGLGIGVVY